MTVIPGTPDPEVLNGTQGDDLITAYGGNDTLYGYGGIDTLYGGSGDDSLEGHFGNDLLFGEGGNDRLIAGGDSDQMFGGSGNDYLMLNDINYAGESTAHGGIGDDTFVIFGGGGGKVYGEEGNDTLFLLARDDNALYVDLASQSLDGHGGFAYVTYSGIEQLITVSNAGDDHIYGGALSDDLRVGSGANIVMAMGGDDQVSYTTRGASTLDGGEGNDVLTVSGGTSSLYFIYDRGDGTIDDGQGSLLTGFETYVALGGRLDDVVGLGTGDDSFYGGLGADTAAGYDGADWLSGLGGADSLLGEAGNDQLFGGGGNDALYGGDGADFLGGGSGDDLLFGGAGNDRIRMTEGLDTATGGAGRDRFIFAQQDSGPATVTDFHSGEDQLRFTSAYLTHAPSAGPLDPALFHLDAAQGTAAQFVRLYDADSDTTSILWDDNGSDAGGTHLFALFTGDVMIAAADIFIL